MTRLSAPFPKDLALALACAEGDPEALATFEREVMPKAVSVAAGLLPSADAAAELAQALRVHLFVRQTEGPPRVAGYDGSVPFAAWVRAVARRCAMNLRRGSPRWVERGCEEFDGLSLPGLAERAVADERFRVLFNAAFGAAVRSLEARERAVLRLHVADGLTLDEVARAYGVHRATVARWVATARATLTGRTREALARTLGPCADQLDSLLRGAFSRLEVNISSVFRDPTPAPQDRIPPAPIAAPDGPGTPSTASSCRSPR